MNNKPINIAIVWANPYNENLGVAALAYSALALVADVMNEENQKCNISIFGSSKATKEKLGINGNTYEFDNIKGLDFLTFKSLVKLSLFSKRFQLRKILNLDYILDIAEGDSFTDIYGDVRFRKILNSKKVFKWLGKKQLLLPQTIGPFNKTSHKKGAFKVMGEIDTVISRDKQSYEYTARHLPSQKIQENIDVAFYLPFKKLNNEDSKIHVGINVSGLLWNGGYTQNNQFGLKTDYKKLILETISYFSKIEKIQIHLVGHVISSLENSIEDDYGVCLKLKEQFPNIVVAPRFKTPIEAKTYISGLDFFTGARMHACIAAFSSGVAVYPMAYSRKFNGLFQETLQYQWMGDCVNENEDEILVNMIEAFNKRELLRDQIDNANKTIVLPRLKQLKSIIKDFIIQ